MATNQNARALSLMNRIQASTGLTEDGKRSLIQLVNPFTDFEMQTAGYTDSDETASVIQRVKYSNTVTKPPGLAAGATWDCNVFNTPVLGETPFTSDVYTADGNVIFRTAAAEVFTFGGVTVSKAPAGENLSMNGLTSAATQDCSANGLCPPEGSSFLDGTSRIIGIGFEVHNTTAEIYRQGACTVYRQPQPYLFDRQARSVLTSAGGTETAPTNVEFQGTMDSYTFSDVPGTLGEAMLLNGSRQWAAEFGAMVVPTLIDETIPVQRKSSVQPLVTSNQPDNTFTYPGASASVATQTAAAIPSFTPAILGASPGGATTMRVARMNRQNKFMNFNTSGAFFTGLSEQTTLVVDTIYYIERFPSPKESDLVVLANPSPKNDPIARELYSLFIREMPVGVKVGDNADGDWFFQGLSAVSKFLQPALVALGGPIGIAGSALASAADSWAQGKLKESNKPSKSKKSQALVKAEKQWDTAAKTKKVGKGSSWESQSGMPRQRPKKKAK